MESKIRRSMLSRSERIDDLETQSLSLKTQTIRTAASVRSKFNRKQSSLSSYLLDKSLSSSSWRQCQNTTSLYKKLTHMRTLSGHQSYPIFCIAFDHVGNSVITGADDYLVKVWCSRTLSSLNSLTHQLTYSLIYSNT